MMPASSNTRHSSATSVSSSHVLDLQIGKNCHTDSLVSRTGQFDDHVIHVGFGSAHAVFKLAWYAVWSHGAGLIASAAFLFSCSSFCVKLITLQSSLPTFEIMIIPSLFCLIGTNVVLHFQGTVFTPDSRSVFGLTILRAVLGSTALALFYLSIQQLPLKDAVTVFFTSPVIVAMLEWAVVPGDSPSIVTVIGCMLTVVGVWLVSQPAGLHRLSHRTTGISMAILAAFANAAAFVTVRLICRQSSPPPSALVLTWWYHLFVICLSALALIARVPAALPQLREVLLLTCISFCQFFGQLMLNRGFQLQSATRGSAVNVLQVVFSYSWDVFVLQSKTNNIELIGAFMVVLGVVTVTVMGSADKIHLTGSADSIIDVSLVETNNDSSLINTDNRLT